MASMSMIFYCSPTGNEPARDWLRDLAADQRRIIGEDLKVVQQGILEEVNAAVLKRVIALQIEDEMRRRKISKSALAKRMHTSRMAVDRLLDTTNGSVTLSTLGRVASALGRRLSVELV